MFLRGGGVIIQCLSSLSQLYIAYCILVDSSTAIGWTSPFVILVVSALFGRLNAIFDGKFCKQTM